MHYYSSQKLPFLLNGIETKRIWTKPLADEQKREIIKSWNVNFQKRASPVCLSCIGIISIHQNEWGKFYPKKVIQI